MPEMITVPPRIGLIPCGVTVMILVVPAVRTAPLVPADAKGAICADVPCCNRFTTEVAPFPPPGVTYDSGTLCCMLTFGVVSVVWATGGVWLGGSVPARKQVCLASPTGCGFASTVMATG